MVVLTTRKAAKGEHFLGGPGKFLLQFLHLRYILKERRIRFWFSARSALGVRTTCRYPD
jgi:hypothetical protein